MKVILSNGQELDILSFTNGILCDDYTILTMLVIKNSDAITTESLKSLFLKNSVKAIIGEDGEPVELNEVFNVLMPNPVEFLDYTTLSIDEKPSSVINVSLMSTECAERYLVPYRNMKLEELSAICKSKIEDGLTVELSGGPETFSYKSDDRENIKQMFDAVVYGATSYPYHCDNQSCKSYTAKDIVSLYVAMVRNKTHHTTYFNQMKQYILDTKSIVAVSEIAYGAELTGDYLDVYNANMLEAEQQLTNIINKIGIKL